MKGGTPPAAAGSTVFVDGTVWAGASPRPVRGWVSVVDGVVDAVGEGSPPPIAAASVVDLAGGHLLPGLVDVHTHLTAAAWSSIALDAAAWIRADDVLDAVRRRASDTPADGWVLGMGLDLDRFVSPAPSADALDEAAAGRPVLIADVTMHRALASPAAMDRGGVIRPGAVPAGDVTRGVRGHLTGLVWESAFGMCWRQAVTDLARQGVDPQQLVAAEARRHLALGLVRIHEPGITRDGAASLAALDVPLRRSWSPALADQPLGEPGKAGGDAPPSVKAWLDGAHRCAVRAPASMLLRAGLVGLVDGLRRRDVAALKEHLGTPLVLADGPGLLVDHHRFTDDELVERLTPAVEDGQRLRLHALGNAAVRQATTVAQRLGCPPLVVEHVVVGDDASSAALAAVGAVVAAQPAFIDGYGTQLRRQGVAAHLTAIPLRSIREAGVVLVLSSDHPCGPLDPLRILRAAVDRRAADGTVMDEAEALDLEQAVAAMTVHAHQALGRQPTDDDPVPGAIVVGAPADLTEIDGAPDQPHTRVRRTWIGGTVAHGPLPADARGSAS